MHLLVKGTIIVINTTARYQPNNGACKKLIFKNCAPVTNCISRINNMQADDARDIDVVVSMYNLTEYSNNYLKISGILWEYCGDEPALNNDVIVDFTADNTITDSFKIKEKKQVTMAQKMLK